jgi:hypothetical protein
VLERVEGKHGGETLRRETVQALTHRGGIPFDERSDELLVAFDEMVRVASAEQVRHLAGAGAEVEQRARLAEAVYEIGGDTEAPPRDPGRERIGMAVRRNAALLEGLDVAHRVETRGQRLAAGADDSTIFD